MRVLAPVLGPVITAEARVLIAGVALLVYFRAIGFDVEWKRCWKQYVLIGGINSALPFFLLSFAALHIPASLSVILNSTSPMFGAVFAAVWLGESLTGKKVIGLLTGAVGVALVTNIGSVKTGPVFVWAVSACIAAAICYGLGACYVRKMGGRLKPKGVAAGSQMMAALLLLPAVPLAPIRGAVSVQVVFTVIVFALLCSAVAYLLYFRLISDVGPTKALTVTFLMPLFGMLWGKILLGESVTATMIAGAALIILGTSLVTRKANHRRK
jgi:drug/metabolite transporter (DMT)-like permease